jgi:t-SNARE complex subunit (syntaxin)
MATSSSRNPFTPPSSTDSEILSQEVTLEEGLARSQLRGMKSVEKKFTDVHQMYRELHGEAVAQQDSIDIVEASTLRTALLSGETVDELKKFKDAKDRKMRCRMYCVGIFLCIFIIWLLLVIGLPRG